MTCVPEVVVELASDADHEVLAALQWRWRVGEWHGAPACDQAEFTQALQTWMQHHQDTHDGFIARMDAEVVGMAWLAVFDRIPTPVKLHRLGGHVQSVYIVPEHREQGIGGALMRRLINRARELGLSWLLVHPSELSFAFYRAHGFEAADDFLELRLEES